MSYQAIENYGLIGDLSTAALVGMDASIDLMCYPHFDSPSIFAAMLDDKRGGHFQIAPVQGQFKRRQSYLPNTPILLTRFLGENAVVEVSDFMPLAHLGHHHAIVRRVKVVRGEVPCRMVCAPRFDYCRAAHTVEPGEREIRFCPANKRLPTLRLRADLPLKAREGDAEAEFTLRAGECANFVLEEVTAGRLSRMENPNYVAEAFKETMNFWLAWSARSNYRGRWREQVNRSALTLKLLTSMENAGIVASPSFGLPEYIGGKANWDYRYTWIRDASFTLDALMDLGYFDEPKAFMKWLEERCREMGPAGPLQVMYRMNGSRGIPEEELPNLEGYCQSSPVRIGNEAAKQFQLDIYGEIFDAVHIYDRKAEAVSYDFWTHLSRIIDWLCAHWRDDDDGIWEVRSGRKSFLTSKVMCWGAIERAIQMARKRSFPAPLARWLRVRDEIFRDIYKNYWNDQLRAFVQHRGAKDLDASALLMPLIRFISPKDPRWESTFRAIQERLVEDSLVYRYRVPPEKRYGQPQGTFTVCSFWYIECMSLMGDLRQARLLFEKMLGYANHLGLYAEELGPQGQQLGNFPLALSHIGLISAALTLNEKLTEAAENDASAPTEHAGTIYAPGPT